MKVILPGSYDPVTLGHLEVIRRAAEKYDEVYAVVFVNSEKKYMFPIEERVKMLSLAAKEFPNVTVDFSLGYVVDYMREKGIEKIFKGYRSDADYAYEMVQAEYNFSHGGYETELFRCDSSLSEVSSTRARELILEGGELSSLLPLAVIEYLKEINAKEKNNESKNDV